MCIITMLFSIVWRGSTGAHYCGYPTQWRLDLWRIVCGVTNCFEMNTKSTAPLISNHCCTPFHTDTTMENSIFCSHTSPRRDSTGWPRGDDWCNGVFFALYRQGRSLGGIRKLTCVRIAWECAFGVLMSAVLPATFVACYFFSALGCSTQWLLQYR